MERTAVNPWKWSLDYGFNQAELIEGPSRQLICSGQAAVDGNGHPQHAGDMRAQVGLALDNLEAVLAGAQMTLGDVVKLTIFTTDVDALMGTYELVAQRFGTAGVQPASTLLGVTRLAFPELMVELEATAAA